jgi:hypothetical protein
MKAFEGNEFIKNINQEMDLPFVKKLLQNLEYSLCEKRVQIFEEGLKFI